MPPLRNKREIRHPPRNQMKRIENISPPICQRNWTGKSSGWGEGVGGYFDCADIQVMAEDGDNDSIVGPPAGILLLTFGSESSSAMDDLPLYDLTPGLVESRINSLGRKFIPTIGI